MLVYQKQAVINFWSMQFMHASTFYSSSELVHLWVW